MRTMPAVARVAVDLSLDRCFDYSVPDALAGTALVGSRVSVPFGRRQATGYVVERLARSAHQRLKPIAAVLSERPMLPGALLPLARWMAEYYCAPLEASIRSLLPSAVRRKVGAFRMQRIVAPVSDGGPTGEELDALRRRAPKQSRVLQYVVRHGVTPLSVVMRATSVTAAPVKGLAEKGYLVIREERVDRVPTSPHTVLPTAPLTLMPAQAAALEAIVAGVEREVPHVVLLHGVTGSGKTEVYMQALDRVLQRGQSGIVLVPEIALTPQTVERFVGRFGERVAVMHSHLSDGERHDEWHRMREGRAQVVVGARSAVFAPFENLGLIVVDEEHEPSYKQDEAPRYNARDVAVMRGHMEQCSVVLGSATPSLESWANVLAGKYELANLPERADNRRMPHIRVVDMRTQKDDDGRTGVFSSDLLDAIRQRLDRAEQTILFLNRRGYSTSLICRQCGFVAVCDHCSVSLTYHRHDDRLRCHICAETRHVPDRCPECFDPSFKYSGIGTQRVETIVRKCFPHARVERLDTDTTSRKDAYQRVLGGFRAGKIDILIGTQMIAKGLHFPNVTLVGIVYADLSLHMPDFRAGERTFQLLAQVAGRAGRGDVSGEVIVQTYTPFHPAVQKARRLDYDTFCDEELAFRRELSYPPAAHLVLLKLKGGSEQRVTFCAGKLQQCLCRAAPKTVLVSDACPAPLARARGKFRYQILVRSRSVAAINKAVRAAMAEAQLPRDVQCAVDVDALSVL